MKKQKELLLRENESLQQMAAEGLEMQIVSNTIEHGSKAQLSCLEFQCPYCNWPSSEIFRTLGVFHFNCRHCHRNYRVVVGEHEFVVTPSTHSQGQAPASAPMTLAEQKRILKDAKERNEWYEFYKGSFTGCHNIVRDNRGRF